ncbi:MAG: ABC transporter permease, partial [Planctomycetota bacterium]|jgi:putative ABC transport system permease protein
VSLSAGITATLRNSLQMLTGVVVMRNGSIDPIFSSIPTSLAEEIEAMPEVKATAREVWLLATTIDGQPTLTKGMMTAAGAGGMHDDDRATLSRGGFYRSHLTEGRWVQPGETDSMVISEKLAAEYAKQIGDPIEVRGRQFTLVGLYRTGSLFLDQACIMPYETAREMHGFGEAVCSTIYVEAVDGSPEGLERVAQLIQTKFKDRGVEAITPKKWLDHVAGLLTTLDVFLLAVSSFACIVGAIGVVNTMLMSVTERVREFGILKAVGWTRADVAKLVVVEALGLGVFGGAVGSLLGLVVVELLKGLLPFEPLAPPWVVAVGFVGSIVLGLVGGMYPAWRAASMDPVEAIRWE